MLLTAVTELKGGSDMMPKSQSSRPEILRAEVFSREERNTPRLPDRGLGVLLALSVGSKTNPQQHEVFLHSN